MSKLTIGKLLVAAAFVSMFFITVQNAFAEPVEQGFEWQYTPEDQALIDGFRILDQDTNVVLDAIAPEARNAVVTFENNGKDCRSFYIVAYKGEDYSYNSAIATYCPPRKPLTAVGTFKLIIEE